MNRRLFLKSAAALALAPRLFADDEKPAEEFFTVVALPDTQFYSLKHPQHFHAQADWIVANAQKERIAYVAHEGDLTHLNTEAEWAVADVCMKKLEGVVPYGVLCGNHDYAEKGSAKTRDAARYNRAFPVERFAKRAWYGGHFGETNENSFQLFEAGGMKFIAVCLEFGPRDEVLEWAGKVLGEHKDRRAIVNTHGYMFHDDTRLGAEDPHNPRKYGCGGNNGDEIWEKLVRKHGGVFLVVSGHVTGDGVGRSASKNDAGGTVHELLANYQMLKEGGLGKMRLMRFEPAKNRILVKTWSPSLGEFDATNGNAFELGYEMSK